MLKDIFKHLFGKSSSNENAAQRSAESTNRSSNRSIRQGCLRQNLFQEAATPEEEFPNNEPFPLPPEDYLLSGPFCSNNLTVFLIHGKDQLQGQSILSLEEAMALNKVVVAETGNVGALSVRNLADDLVFLQSGDIVRGGRQDRTIKFDMLLAKGAAVALPTLCVEQHRWSQRANESAEKFSSSHNHIYGKQMKMAARQSGARSQGDVWEGVRCNQTKLRSKIGFSTSELKSASSYDLTMESSTVKSASQEYIDKLEHVIDDKADVVGFAFAINGKLNSADVYASHELFKKLWLKMLKSAVVEALAEKSGAVESDNSAISTNPQSEFEILKFLASAQEFSAKKKFVCDESIMLEQEGPKTLLYRTQWIKAANPHTFVHCNFIHK